MATTKLGLPTITGNMGADVVRDLNALANAVDGKVAVANGLASLDGTGKVPSGQLPVMDYVPTSQKGVANGVATLGSDGKVPTAQLPPISNTASDVTITDTGGYYTGTNAESALQEIGQTLNAMRGSLVTTTNSILGS
jgi:hypothetical protein